MKRLALMLCLAAMVACGKVAPKEEVAQVKQATGCVPSLACWPLECCPKCPGVDPEEPDTVENTEAGGCAITPPNAGTDRCALCQSLRGPCNRNLPLGYDTCIITMDLYCRDAGNRCPNP